jgi:hypothetical protein
MAASLTIEEESGIYTSRVRHPHNGYYAGNFSQVPRPVVGLRPSHAERPREFSDRASRPDVLAVASSFGSPIRQQRR